MLIFRFQVRHSQIPSLPDLNVTGAWTLGFTGRGSVVTFLDDGLEFEHPDLQENYVSLIRFDHRYRVLILSRDVRLGQRSQYRYQ